MLAIQVTLLGGVYRASAFNDRSQPEWPPHPARLFYAAVNTVHDCAEPAPDELAALRWWESLGAPHITCSDRRADNSDAWTSRTGTEHYVPINHASSHQRDLQSKWSELRELRSAVDTEADEKARGKLQKKLHSEAAKFATAVASATKPKGNESQSVTSSVLELLPDNRNKQARYFPSITPDNPSITFFWPHADISDHIPSLDAILARIGRLGHSTTAVSCAIVDDAPRPTFVPALPGQPAELNLRTTRSGLLEALIEEFARHQGRGERFMTSDSANYRRNTPAGPIAVDPQQTGEWILLDLPTHQKLPLSRTQDVARAVRDALISHAAEPVSPLISGHGHGSSPHIAVLALPNVTSIHSDGLIQAIAIAQPAGTSPEARTALVQALDAWLAASTDDGALLRLPGGTARQLGIPRVDNSVGTTNQTRRVSSRAFWAVDSTSWSTVTPVAFDRYPKVKRESTFDDLADAAAPIVEKMCARVGLPAPTQISLTPVSLWPSVPVVRGARAKTNQLAFPQYRVGGNGDGRYTSHLTISFDEPVRGPITLGAGRFFGYGLMYPTPKAAR